MASYLLFLLFSLPNIYSRPPQKGKDCSILHFFGVLSLHSSLYMGLIVSGSIFHGGLAFLMLLFCSTAARRCKGSCLALFLTCNNILLDFCLALGIRKCELRLICQCICVGTMARHVSFYYLFVCILKLY